MVYSIWDGLAFKIIVFLSGLQSIDKQYYQAAQIDATPRWRVFRRITVPLLSPMILYITITSFMGAFKVYSSVIGIFGTGRYGPVGNDKLLITIVGYVYEQFNVSGMPFGVGSAGSLILFLIILLITGIQMQVSKKRVHY
jgi:multiple sugar transport system permease protein